MDVLKDWYLLVKVYDWPREIISEYLLLKNTFICQNIFYVHYFIDIMYTGSCVLGDSNFINKY